MTTRNQRRNRKLAIARERIKHLEAVVCELRARLAEVDEDEGGGGSGSPEAMASLQAEYNRRMSKYIAVLADNRTAP